MRSLTRGTEREIDQTKVKRNRRVFDESEEQLVENVEVDKDLRGIDIGRVETVSKVYKVEIASSSYRMQLAPRGEERESRELNSKGFLAPDLYTCAVRSMFLRLVTREKSCMSGARGHVPNYWADRTAV